MVWARLDDAILDNPKITEAGALGLLLHVAAITWCARNLSDGRIPIVKARQLVDLSGVYIDDGNDGGCPWFGPRALAGGCSTPEPDRIAQHLIDVGLWERDGEDLSVYVLHDFLAYNPSREAVESNRAAKVEAGRRGGRASAQARAQAPAQAEREQSPKQNPTPVPVPVPVNTENLDGSLPNAADLVAFYVDETTRCGGLAMHKGAIAGEAKRLLQGGIPDELLRAAITRMVEKARPASALRGLIDEINRERNGHAPRPAFESAGERRTRETEELFAQGGWKP
jgi:hypothetical protein